MPNFSKRSKKNISEVHHDLQQLCYEAIQVIDFAVIEGYRPEFEQNSAYELGNSTLKYPDSKHNKKPAEAIDIIPFVRGRFTGWEDREAFVFLAGHMLAIAEKLYKDGRITHRLRWGGDWNMNHDLSDQSFDDLPHFELI